MGTSRRGGSGPTTRGGLSPAKIINLNNQDTVNFMFNPFEFSISKSVSWTPGKEQGVDAPDLVFSRGEPRKLSLVLHFDTQESGSDVQALTKKLWKMSEVDKSAPDYNRETKKGLPPCVSFEWGSIQFKAIITSITEKFTLFDAKGTPLRCEVNIDLQEYLQSEQKISKESAGEDNFDVVTQTGSDRPDNTAVKNGGSPSDTRKLMEANNVDDPLRMPTGKQLQRK